REQGTGNREQGTGNREQGTGNREQGTGNREQGTGNREKGTGNREYRTGNREHFDQSYRELVELHRASHGTVNRKEFTWNRLQERGFAVSVSRTVLGNFTFRYLCWFFPFT
ncbi:MAG: hypothetical protein ACK4YY_09925, partial [Dolichospermum sp.]